MKGRATSRYYGYIAGREACCSDGHPTWFEAVRHAQEEIAKRRKATGKK